VHLFYSASVSFLNKFVWRGVYAELSYEQSGGWALARLFALRWTLIMGTKLKMQSSEVRSGSLEVHLPLVFPRHMWDMPEIPLSSGSNDAGTLLLAVRDVQQPGTRERALMALRNSSLLRLKSRGLLSKVILKIGCRILRFAVGLTDWFKKQTEEVLLSFWIYLNSYQ